MQRRVWIGLILCVLVLLPVNGFAQSTVQLTEEWVRLADAQGARDQERGLASAESAEFSPDGTLIVSGSKGRFVGNTRQGQSVKLWRVSDGNLLWDRPRADEVEAVAFAPNGEYVAAGGEDRKVEILRVRSGSTILSAPQLIATLEHDAPIDSLRFSHDGKLLATGAEDQRVRIWRTSDWKRMKTEVHGGTGDNAVNSVDFTSDDQYLATAGSDRRVRIWQVQRTENGGAIQSITVVPVRTLTGHTGSVKTVRFSPDDTLIAAGAAQGSGVRIWTFNGTLVRQIPATGWIMETVEWTPDGAFLVTGGNEGEEDDDNGPFPGNNGFGAIRFYDARQNYNLVLTTPVFRQEYLHFTSNGQRMVSSHEDGTIRLWRVNS